MASNGDDISLLFLVDIFNFKHSFKKIQPSFKGLNQGGCADWLSWLVHSAMDKVSISFFSVVLTEIVLSDQASHLTDVSHWPQGTQARQWWSVQTLSIIGKIK